MGGKEQCVGRVAILPSLEREEGPAGSGRPPGPALSMAQPFTDPGPSPGSMEHKTY